MKKPLKSVDYKGSKYIIMMVKRQDGTWFLKDYKNDIPFSPYYFGIDANLDAWGKLKLEEILNQPIMKYLISEAELGIKFWVDNKDKIKALLKK